MKENQFSDKESDSDNFLDRVLIKKSDRIIFLDLEDVHCIESSGNYLEFHLDEKTHLLRGSLSKLEQKLDPQQFIRIHRSSIVNISKVSFISPWNTGDYKVMLDNGRDLRMSRTYKDSLDRFKLT